jgi:hypothetical protein
MKLRQKHNAILQPRLLLIFWHEIRRYALHSLYIPFE